MPVVSLDLSTDDGNVLGTPVVVTATPRRPGPLVEALARVGLPSTLTLAEGDHDLRVLLPSGRTVTGIVTTAGPVTACELRLGADGGQTALFTAAARHAGGVFPDSAWARFWHRTAAGWRVTPWPALPRPRTRTRPRADARTYALYLPDRPCMIQVGAAGRTPSFTVLPPDRFVEVTIRPGKQDEDIAVFATTTDVAGEALRGYLACGALNAAHRLAGVVTADRCAGRIALGHLRLHGTGDWPGTAHDNPIYPDETDPDEATIRGWRHMHQGATDRARDCFRRAAELGPPVYPESLRLLTNALQRFDDPASRSALARLRICRRGAQPTVTFPGATPDRPDPTATDEIDDLLPHRHTLAALSINGHR